MHNACLTLRAKGVRCSCRTAFAVERYILARVVPSRAFSKGRTSSIPYVISLICEDCSLWLELSAAGAEGVAGFLAEGLLFNPPECGGIVSRGVLSYPLVCLPMLVFRSPHSWQMPYRFERRVFCNGFPILSRKLFPSPG